MDARKLQQVYLRAMYTGAPATVSSEEDAFFIAQSSAERLIVEHAARIRNLRTVLHDDMRLLKKVLDKASLLPHVKAYAESDLFWMHRGRTLIEDFCLYFVEHTSATPVHKLLACIEGVCSGLSIKTAVASPWDEHDMQQRGDVTTETFLAPFSLPFKQIFDSKSDFQPTKQPVTCVIRKSGAKINVKFIKD
ncbi:hypothetical protein [Burkholderia sp. TSV86]|uniref:hypothetical protein n=1 Tax=Burkholderia sp. TSV86 TaxID=1385594 RepID=UPI00075F16B7|nr:hypothetical protein [Burkholderia sp. TSV86]KVE38180.1 hypothetical protein WS68_24325 [Burkholderia sp. TSV86]